MLPADHGPSRPSGAGGDIRSARYSEGIVLGAQKPWTVNQMA